MNLNVIFSLLFSFLYTLSIAQSGSLQTVPDSLTYVLKTVQGEKRVETLNLLAWEYRNTEPIQALKYIAESITLAKSIDYQKGLAYALRTKASIHWNMGNYTVSAESALAGLEIMDNLKDSLGVANVYLILGNIYSKQGNKPFSYDYYQKALHIFQALGEQSRVAAALNNLAEILVSKGDYKQATVCIIQAQAINRKSTKKQGKISLAHNLNNLGFLYFKQGTYDSALMALEEGEQISKAIGDESVRIILHDTYLTFSYIYLLKKQMLLAIDYAQKALLNAEKINLKVGIRDSYKQLAEIYGVQNDIPNAYAFQKKYITFNDSILNEESIKKIADMQAQYENMTKEKEILKLKDEKVAQELKIKQQIYLEYLLGISLFFIGVIAFIFYKNQRNQRKINQLLESKNQEIEQQKLALERMNATKDKFFSIVSHDLKSPMNSLKGFSHLLATYAEGMSAEEIKKIAIDLNKSVNNTLELTNNLLTWARLQMESIDFNPAILDLNTIIQGQLALLQPTAHTKNNKLFSRLTPDLKAFADENHLDFILRNLIVNALKFTQDGEILVSTLHKDKTIEIAIKDTGKGMDATFIQHIFDVGHKSSTLGTAGEKGTGLGLPLCKEFVEKNGGKIWVESTKNQGSTFYFTVQIGNAMLSQK